MCLCTGTKHTTKTKAKGTKKDCSYAKIHTIQRDLYESLSFTKMFATLVDTFKSLAQHERNLIITDHLSN